MTACTNAENELVAIRNVLDKWLGPDDATIPKALSERIDAEMSDYFMIMRHTSAAYMHMSGGQVSKPNTLPEVVIGLSEEREGRNAQCCIDALEDIASADDTSTLAGAVAIAEGALFKC